MRRPDLRRYPLQRAAACSGMIADRFGPLNMRVAGVDPERKFGGGEVQVLGLTLELKRAGHEVELLCDHNGILWRRAQQASKACWPLRIRNSLDFLAGFRLFFFKQKTAYDIVHFHTA